MEALTSVWECDPCDPSDLGLMPPSVHESPCELLCLPPAGHMCSQQLSPHLQRNKQLQDILLQREEELFRLQEENQKLKEFLSSSFVRNLKEKAKRLSDDGKRNLKRNLTYIDDGPFQNCHHQLPPPQHVSKRVCRNLTAEFCSQTSTSEPHLDLWVLRTLGLKDHYTIDTSNDNSSCSGGGSLNSFVKTSPSESSLDSWFSPSLDSSSVPNSCRTLTHSPAQSPLTPRAPGSDFTVSGLTGPFEAPAGAIRSYDRVNSFNCSSEEPVFSWSSGRSETCSATVQIQAEPPAYWTPACRVSSQDRINCSPPGERVLFTPILSSSPVMNEQWTSVCSPAKPAGSQTHIEPRADLVFRMSLSPSCNVRTHSFPQGQAFIRKNPEGRWNFTWVPRQGP